MDSYDLIVIGAGPAGLSCAIEAKRQRLSCLVIDKGSIVDAIRRFPTNLTFFSSAELLEIGGIPFTASGLRPTRLECVRYYQTVARHYGLAMKLGEKVLAVHKGSRGFDIRTGAASYLTSSVVVATGYFDHPNAFDVPGANLPKVLRYYDEPYAYYGKNVAVVGGKNSAVELALDLYRNGVNVNLIHRGPQFSEGVKYWILPDIENRIRAGEITAFFATRVHEVRAHSIVLEGKRSLEIANDYLFVMIGYEPDTSMLERAGVQIDPGTLGPVHGPQTMETNVKGLYVAGSIAAGRFNNKIFIENGREHGKLIVSAMLGAR